MAGQVLIRGILARIDKITYLHPGKRYPFPIEFATAIILIAGGIAMLRSIPWSRTVLALGLGMVVYSEVVSPGYFAQRNEWVFVAIFTVLLIGAVGSAMPLLGERSPLKQRGLPVKVNSPCLATDANVH